MTELLEKAITAIKKLPPDSQDAIAARLLEEVSDAQAWSERFDATTDSQWDMLANKVRRTIANGEVAPLDDIFPPDLDS
jgi:hypothetical protein